MHAAGQVAADRSSMRIYIYARDGTTGIRPTICRPARAQQHAARTLRTTAFGGRRRRRAPMPERLASSGHRRRRRARVLPAGSGGVPLLEQKHVRHQQLSPSPPTLRCAGRAPVQEPGPSRRQALRMISLCCLLCFPPSHSLSLSRSLNIVRSIFFLRKEPFQKEDERDRAPCPFRQGLPVFQAARDRCGLVPLFLCSLNEKNDVSSNSMEFATRSTQLVGHKATTFFL
jgi:hypothetical protein